MFRLSQEFPLFCPIFVESVTTQMNVTIKETNMEQWSLQLNKTNTKCKKSKEIVNRVPSLDRKFP